MRSGAKKNDIIFVTGGLGGSLKSGRHLNFRPKIRESRVLVEHLKVNAMMDLSDGLAMDLNRVAEASGLGALLFESRIPLEAGVPDLQNALHDGEDFELLFTVSHFAVEKLSGLMREGKAPIRFFPIGRMTDKFEGVKILRFDGCTQDVLPKGFEHFASGRRV